MANSKTVTLNMQQRLEVLKDLETSSTSSVAAKYNVHHTTIWRIKQRAMEIAAFQGKDVKEMGRQKLRKPTYAELEGRLFRWFVERKTVGDFISERQILQKATELKEEIGGCSKFRASRGWLANFKNRYRIRLLRVCPEKISADHDAANKFKSDFQKGIEEKGIDLQNVYNMSECRLLWKALPAKIVKAENIKYENRHPMRKDKITIGLCVNATGTHKIMPLLIYKYEKPRALKNCIEQLPVILKSQTNADINQTLFVDWFENHFKKAVQRFQLDQGLKGKVILLVSDGISHKFPSNYVHDDNFEVKYLPANTSSVIQPMNKGITEELKRNFRHKLVQRVRCSSDVENFYKEYTIKDCMEMIVKTWDEVTCDSIKDAWKQIVSNEKPGDKEGIEEKENIMTQAIKEQPGEYLAVCIQEDKKYSAELRNMKEDRDKEKNETSSIEREEERNEESDEEMEIDRCTERNEEEDEESDKAEEIQECGIKLIETEKEELQYIFKRLEHYKNRIPRSSQLLVEAIKLVFLGDRTLKEQRESHGN